MLKNDPTYCLSVFDHFVELVLRGLTYNHAGNSKAFWSSRKSFSIKKYNSINQKCLISREFDKRL